MSREFTIQYGDYIINESNKRYLDGKYTKHTDFTKTTVTFAFVIVQDTEAHFNAEIATTEAAFRQPFRDFVLKQNNTTMLVLSHSQGTGLNTRPTIIKQEDVVGTGRSRKYTVEISCEMPADNVSKVGLPTGLRESHIAISTAPQGKRHIDISGTVTAITTDTSFNTYKKIINMYCMAIINSMGGVFELVEKPQEKYDQTNKLLDFSRVYEEIIYPQAGATFLDDPNIVRQQLKITRAKVAPGDTVNTKRLVTYTVSYSAYVKFAEEQQPSSNQLLGLTNEGLTGNFNIGGQANANIGGSFQFQPEGGTSNPFLNPKKADVEKQPEPSNPLDAIWQKKIRPFIIEQVKKLAGNASIALVNETPDFEMDNNIITASMVFMTSGGSNIFEQEVAVKDTVIFGKVLVAAWTGNTLSKYPYDGPKTVRRTVTNTFKLLSQPQPDATIRDINEFIKDTVAAYKVYLNPIEAAGTDQVQISSDSDVRPKTMGFDGIILNYSEVVLIDIYEFYTDARNEAPGTGTEALNTPAKMGRAGLFGGKADSGKAGMVKNK